MTARDSTDSKAPASAPERCLRGIASLWDGRRLHRDVAVRMSGGRVSWIGRDADAQGGDDLGGAIVLPALVDCHTHSLFGGTRVDDFERRLRGETYTAILEAGGGIHATVRGTTQAGDDTLRASLQARVAGMRAGGVGCVEVKSGYGLSPAAEARMLRLAREAAGPTRIVTTFLGAHALPPGRERGEYVDEVVGPQLRACRPYADAIDVYCDRGAFTLAEAERILRAGKAAGLGLRIHAEQVTHTGAAAMAARLGATSADHLEYLDDEGIAAMAEAGTVAVLLPGAMVYLRDPPPPVAKLRAAGVPMAVATDFNPGSSPVRDLLSCATLACVTMGLTVEEALAGVTRHAAAALGRPELGELRVGGPADLAVFRPPPGEPADARVLVQYLGGHRVERLYLDGAEVSAAPG